MNIAISAGAPGKPKSENFWKKLRHFKTASLMLKGRSPGQLVIQLTDKCNARCPQCGMNTTNRFQRSVINTDDAKRAIDHAASQGVQSLSFTGGEPFLVMKELMELINHAQDAGIPFIRTGTNGFFFVNDHEEELLDRVKWVAESLAGTDLYTFWISIDSSCRNTHEGMRGLRGMLNGLEKALPVFHSYGVYPAANLGINRNMSGIKGRIGTGIAANDPFADVYYYEQCFNAFESYYRFILDIGFTITNTCYPMSFESSADGKFDPVYNAVSQNTIVRFSGPEKVQIYRALFDAIERFRSRIRIFTPRSSLYRMIEEHLGKASGSYACRGGIDYFFMDSRNGDVFPCGYRGSESMGKFWNIDLNEIRMKPYCRLCEWECFRDPSTLLGPILDPGSLVDKFVHDRDFISLWHDDLRYYAACDFFNGRKPMSTKKLAKFNKQ